MASKTQINFLKKIALMPEQVYSQNTTHLRAQISQSYCHVILCNLKVWRNSQTPEIKISPKARKNSWDKPDDDDGKEESHTNPSTTKTTMPSVIKKKLNT